MACQDGGCDFFKWYNGQMCDRATELLRQLCDCEQNLSKENSSLKKKVIDLVTFDGSQNGSSSITDI
ncbi:hypothetical protein PVK06_008778 [Gossypium arboreum]|uniref:Uncharacterized protein n=1 Tax=Gossypium arboreum TaxID=29729 RepID=A0ABR0QKS9_GOSAR|nr:hypothetical protein PVK06_008778 [Gossypium arboreum]